MNALKCALVLLIILLNMLWSVSVAAQPQSQTKTQTTPRVLLVLSGYGQPEQQAPGYEFDEFAKAYLVLNAHGIAVDVASPQGGKVEADQFDPSKPFNQQVLNDPTISVQLANTLAIAKLNAESYQGIYIIGGKGAMFDLPNDLALQQLIAAIYQQDGVVAAVCHGPAALVNVQLADGSYLVAGKAVNSFTNQEERLFGKKWLSKFEFMLEDKLIERGGRFQASPMMLSHVVADQRLITGQNPASTVPVTMALVAALGVAPIALPGYKDDLTLAQIAAFLAGDTQALPSMSAAPEQYQLELAGAYGFYYLQAADTDLAKQQALALMQLGQSTINHASLDLAIAKTQLQLGDKTSARATLTEIVRKDPQATAAQDLLNTL